MRKIRTIEMQRLTVEKYQRSEKLPLVVVLDDVRSMYNIGKRLCFLNEQKSTPLKA